ncbi:serine-threonine protein kinase [Theileria orientalis]|uniref:Serine-threonine protein kinase n=1 Tax=Theileria orientalis TaxID=68886 RepID=A0A976M3K1_THEOR|nr:serine-threonine protein kinase [Theileria orientalis]
MSHEDDYRSVSNGRYYRKRESSWVENHRRPSSRRYGSRHLYNSSNYRHRHEKYSRYRSRSFSRTNSSRRYRKHRGSPHRRRHHHSSRKSSLSDTYYRRGRRYSSHRRRSHRSYRKYSGDRYRKDSSHRRRRRSSDRYYEKRRSHRKRSHDKRPKSPTDEIIHFKWERGMNLSDYVVLNKVSDGTFGRVLLCEREGKEFAVKVVRDVEKYTQSAKIEADILLDIKKSDLNAESHCVVLHDNFMYRNRNMCLVFENLGPSLYDFLEKNDFKGFFIADIQKMAYQLLKGLSFLRKKRLIHTDIKPENILLVSGKNDFIEVPFPRSATGMMTKRPATSDIKLIDFGSAIYEDEYHSSIINTRQYRAPEVILDVGWSYSSDLWSLGCTLMELYTGNLLFRTHSHMEHLAMMEKIIGPFPDNMIVSARKSHGKDYVAADSPKLNWPDGAKSKSSIYRVDECRPLLDLVKPEHRVFGEFIRYILNLDPSKRPTPEEAMEHQFFMLKLPEN